MSDASNERPSPELPVVTNGATSDRPDRPSAPAPSGASTASSAGSPDGDSLEADVIAAIRECYDPEIPVNIYELGLIYKVDVDDDSNVAVQMTLTSPACPVAGSLPGDVESRIRAVPGVHDVSVELVWDPPWHQDMMSEAAKVQLGFF